MSYGLANWWVVHALGWTLLHFLWQGALVALVLWCMLALLRGHRSQLRYAAACCALALMVVLPVVTFAHLAPAARWESMQRTLLRFELDTTVTADGSGAFAEPLKDRFERVLDGAAPWVPAVWLAGVVLFLVRLSFGLGAARRMKTSESEPPPLELQLQFELLRVRLGVTRAVRLLHSAAVQVPTVIGWLRPVVLIPVSCLTGLSAAQIEAVMCHELAHIRRHDYLVSVFQSVVEALLFYHPAVWWVSRQIRRERECCCDELAVAVGGDVLTYARALSYLEERRALTAAIVLGANGGVLKMRIKRLLGGSEGPAVSMPAVVALALAVTIGMGAYLGEVAYAQRQAAVRMTAVPLIGTQARAMLQQATGESFVQSGAAPGLAANEGMPQSPDDGTPAARGIYKAWVEQDVRWIITDPERAAFLQLKNDQERDTFIEQFWARRDPPGAPAGSYREQIYQRIAYANEHFATDRKAGWLTDRGHVYIVYGQPDEITVHKGGAYSFQSWHYNYLSGIGDNVLLNFVDTSGGGDYHYTIDGPGGGAQNAAPSAGTAVAENAAKILAPPQVHAAQAQGDGSIEGTVFDPGGAVIRRAKVTSTNTDTGAQMIVQTDDNGKYSLTPLPTGPYNVEVEARSFARSLQENVHVRTGEQVGLNFKLTVGPSSESITVTGAQSAAAAGPQAGGGPALVSPGLMAKQAISQLAPVYPPIAKAAHVQGVVVLHAIISKAGTVESLAVVNGPPMLTASAVEAVKHWTYEPYLLNGRPVEVETTINVNFTFGSAGAAALPPPPPPPPSAGMASQAQEPDMEVHASGAAQPPTPGRPLRVSAGVAAGMAISQPTPVYPDEAKAAHVQGVVVLHALISKEGEIEDLQVISGPPLLVESAIDAVKQWKYRPYLLNGEPTEMETTINVHYTLGEEGPAQQPAGPGRAEAQPLHTGTHLPVRTALSIPKTDAAGDQIRRIGGDVSAPLIVYKVDPEFTEQARKAKAQGVVLVNLVVDRSGKPTNVHVIRGVGHGLDKEAVDAVSQYRFRPAEEYGKPVPVALNVEVNFQIF